MLRFNIETAPDGYAEIAPFLFPALGTSANRAAEFCTAIEDLIARVGLPPRLRDVGIPRDALTDMAADAMKQTRLLQNNPRKITQADALGIYERAW